MPKLERIGNSNNEIIGYVFYCPGCKNYHEVAIAPNKNSKGASWTFNGSEDKPTFSPSILSKIEFTDRPTQICHSFVTDGEIKYLPDCTHNLTGKTVELPDVE
jgi:hypothetical protein